MSDTTWLSWLTGNHNEDQEWGPLFAGYGFALAGMKAREQYEFGIVDLAVHARTLDESGSEAFSWMTRNEDGDRESRLELAPRDHVLVGLELREQASYGVVDARCIFQSLSGSSGDVVYGDWLCHNSRGDVRRGQCPLDHAITGIRLREQGGYGVIDVRLAFTPISRIKPPPATKPSQAERRPAAPKEASPAPTRGRPGGENQERDAEKSTEAWP